MNLEKFRNLSVCAIEHNKQKVSVPHFPVGLLIRITDFSRRLILVRRRSMGVYWPALVRSMCGLRVVGMGSDLYS